MKTVRTLGSIAAGLLGLAGSLQTASAFEGHIDMQIVNAQRKDPPMVLHYTMKGDEIRFDLPQDEKSRHKGSIAMIIDPVGQQIITLIDSDGKKIAMRHAITDPNNKSDTAAANAELAKRHPPTPTGRTETILGYPASEYKTTDSQGREVDLWLAKGLGTYMGMDGGRFARRSAAGNLPSEWQSFAKSAGFFPMRMIVLDKNAKESMRMEVTKVDKTSIPESAFSTAGYEDMKMPSFGEMFGH